jgi:hypothetical protein
MRYATFLAESGVLVPHQLAAFDLVLIFFWTLQAWYDNVPHVGLVQYKKDQNWVKKQGEKLIFPGGGTQFKHGAGHYIDWVQKVRLLHVVHYLTHASDLLVLFSWCFFVLKIFCGVCFCVRFTQLLGGGSKLVSCWMWAVVWLVLEVTCTTGTYLPCPLPRRMNTRLKFSWRWREEFLPFRPSWARNALCSPATHLMLSTVLVAGCLGMLMVQNTIPLYIHTYKLVLRCGVESLADTQ